MGFKAIAIDTAGHGNTQGLPSDGQNLVEYSALLGRIIDELGITRYVLAGHSMGGRLITQLAADRPEQVIAVILIDAIVGDTWDKMVYLFRIAPPLLVGVGAALAVDSVGVIPLFRDPRQAAKLVRLVTPTIAGHLARPWRLAGPMISILRSRSSRYALNELAHRRIPLFALHGTRDIAVPLRTAREAVARTNGTLVSVEGGGHSWLLRDPESLPAIVAQLLEGELGDACREMLRDAGLRSEEPTVEQIESVCYAPDARIFSLTPMSRRTEVVGRHRRPKYHWTVETAEELASA